MSARRGWVERLSGGRTASTTEPSASRPEPGPDRPVRSNGPERPPLPGPGARARPPVPDPRAPPSGSSWSPATTCSPAPSAP